ncbi:MAG: hypothetical protein K8T26_06420 [Lentisphaerae bacterium]|nr:hypothetical protein [Lentisphaerota bacterium]
MKTVSVYFANHFDLTWRRCWMRDTLYQGRRFASYRHIESLCLQRNMELAERGDGAYVVEQGLTMRAFLEANPTALPRLQALYRAGRFEMCGSGEAIIDINLCSFETLCRNLASGVHYCRHVLGMPPLLACHDDGFGSSAQFPQVIRQCGLPGIQGLSYSLPDNTYWRGLDGSWVLVWTGAPGRQYFFDHCYHEPCRQCAGHGVGTCAACRGTGLDLPQNFYPPFDPVPSDAFRTDQAAYVVKSEEMLPPEGFTAHLRRWEAADPGTRYVWATPRRLAPLWEPLTRIDQPPADQIASRIENNPVQTGCYVSRIKVKQEARRCEAHLYGLETVLALACPDAMDASAWQGLFLELPFFFFHDAITGTHQDEAYAELMDRMRACRLNTHAEAGRTLGRAGLAQVQLPAAAAAGVTIQAITTALEPFAQRIPLADSDWRGARPLVAVTAAGRRWPVVYAWHPWFPALPPDEGRLIDAVGSAARTRPDATQAFVEIDCLDPLQWEAARLEPARAPAPLDVRELRNEHLAVTWDDHGVTAIRCLTSGAVATGDALSSIGGLMICEDEGDPWGTRKLPAFRHPLTPFTRCLGAQRFEGYAEVYFAGRYEPNLRFGREADPAMFALEWTITARLLDAARRVDIEYEVFWKTANRRLCAVFPVQAESDTAWYSVPGGVLERPRYEQTETCLWSPNGDWPALYGVAARPAAGSQTGWGVLNYGTPAARVDDGRIVISLLRSPGFGHCLERYAQEYPMPTSGIRDSGWHHVTLSVAPHAGAADVGRFARQAAALNLGVPAVATPPGACLPAPALHIAGHGLQLIAAKRPFDGADAQVVRLLNAQAETTVAVLRDVTGGARPMAGCRLTEDADDPGMGAGELVATFRPHEVRTFYIRKA